MKNEKLKKLIGYINLVTVRIVTGKPKNLLQFIIIALIYFNDKQK